MLVHGAWHGPWCWQQLVPLLEAAGRTVITPALPGHSPGHDATGRINFRTYLESLDATLSALNHPVILAGHSMAGMLITMLADRHREKVAGLVYINAYLPCNGDSIFSLMALLPEQSPPIARHMHLSANRLFYSLSPETLTEYFYNTSPPEAVAIAQQSFCRQPSLPLAHRIRLPAGEVATVHKVYICGTLDRVIPIALQRAMLRRHACNEILQLECDHSPFFSTPKALAAILLAQ